MTAQPDHPTLIFAIDGPSGSGKSTVARRVASALHLRYLDTGSLYRALTWSLLEAGIDTTDPESVADHALTVRLDVGTDADAPSIAADGVRVDRQIRGDAVTAAVSAVSAVPVVRRHLLDLQRRLIGDGGIVVEGRDIGSVVAPHAQVKIFLTASDEARAARRSAETASDVAATMQDLQRRDGLDTSRVVSPLLKAPDALEIDATSLDIDGVVARVLHASAAAVGHPGAASQSWSAAAANGSSS
ncbi:MAG: CMP/dCMP kinase [Frankiaceae bacterium]|jgi:cytidylate kinase|nr:CMP/dCMP kinase [Frankiaceae bacterium]